MADLGDAAFLVFLQKRLKTDAGGVQSHTTGRSWSKRSGALWAEYQNLSAEVRAGYAKEAHGVDVDDDEGTSDDLSSVESEVQGAAAPAAPAAAADSGDEDSSSLSLDSDDDDDDDSAPATAQQAVPAAQKVADNDSSALSSLSDEDDDDDDDDDGDVEMKGAETTGKVDADDDDDDSEEASPGGLTREDEYILEQNWVPDAQSLHSFKSSRNYEKKYLPAIREALAAEKSQKAAEAPAAAATTAAPSADELLDKVILEMNPSILEDDLGSYKSSRGYKKKKAEYEAEVARRLAAGAGTAAEPEEPAESPEFLEALHQVILEQNSNLSQSDIQSFKTSRAFKKKKAMYEELAQKRLDGDTSGPSLQQYIPQDAAPKEAAREAPAAERAQKEYGAKWGDYTNAVMLTNIPVSWHSGEADSLTTSIASVRALIAQKSSEGVADANKREIVALQKKLVQLESSLGKAPKRGLLDSLRSDGFEGAMTAGLKSIRPIMVGERHFVGSCMLRYADSAAAGAAFAEMKSKAVSIDGDFGADHLVAFPLESGIALCATHLRPPSLPEPRADTRISPFILVPPPDVSNVRPKRKLEKPAHGHEKEWWENEFAKPKKQRTDNPAVPKQDEGVVFGMNPRKDAEKEEAKAEKVAASKTFEEFVMAKMGLVEESLTSYLSSRKFQKVKSQLESEYKDMQ